MWDGAVLNLRPCVLNTGQVCAQCEAFCVWRVWSLWCGPVIYYSRILMVHTWTVDLYHAMWTSLPHVIQSAATVSCMPRSHLWISSSPAVVMATVSGQQPHSEYLVVHYRAQECRWNGGTVLSAHQLICKWLEREWSVPGWMKPAWYSCTAGKWPCYCTGHRLFCSSWHGSYSPAVSFTIPVPNRCTFSACLKLHRPGLCDWPLHCWPNWLQVHSFRFQRFQGHLPSTAWLLSCCGQTLGSVLAFFPDSVLCRPQADHTGGWLTSNRPQLLMATASLLLLLPSITAVLAT